MNSTFKNKLILSDKFKMIATKYELDNISVHNGTKKKLLQNSLNMIKNNYINLLHLLYIKEDF